MQVLIRPWNSVFINFIIKLPLLKEPMTEFKADFIIVVIDQLIKNMEFIFFTEWANAEKLAYVFLK